MVGGTQTQGAVFGIAPPRVLIRMVCIRPLGVALDPEGPHAFTTNHRTTNNSSPASQGHGPHSLSGITTIRPTAAGSRCPGFQSYCGGECRTTGRTARAWCRWRVAARCPGDAQWEACSPEHPLWRKYSSRSGIRSPDQRSINM